MKKYLIPIFASFLIVSGAYAFKPATLFIETWEGIKKKAVYSQEQADKLFKDGYLLYQGDLLGTSITTINGSDTLSNSRTTINDNFTALNAGKIEISTTTLPLITTLANLATVGTITSGTWSGTAITVAKGGTGLSTLTGGGRLLYSLNSSSLTTLASSSYGSLLSMDSSGFPAWVATSSLGNIYAYPAFSYATSTTWTGTTTIALGTAFVAETWLAAQCFTDDLFLDVSFHDGTNRMDLLTASTTVGTFGFSTNTAFTVGEKRYVDIGTTTASAIKRISCTIKKSFNPY